MESKGWQLTCFPKTVLNDSLSTGSSEKALMNG
jgi:hypothetical protein